MCGCERASALRSRPGPRGSGAEGAGRRARGGPAAGAGSRPPGREGGEGGGGGAEGPGRYCREGRGAAPLPPPPRGPGEGGGAWERGNGRRSPAAGPAEPVPSPPRHKGPRGAGVSRSGLSCGRESPAAPWGPRSPPPGAAPPLQVSPAVRSVPNKMRNAPSFWVGVCFSGGRRYPRLAEGQRSVSAAACSGE